MKLAIVTSYNEPCGIAAYTSALEKTFEKYFDVKIIDLKSAALIANPSQYNSIEAESHIDSICAELSKYDCVNFHLEWGIFGCSLESIERRLLKMFKAISRLILSLHTLNIRSSDGVEWQSMERRVIESLKNRDHSRPYWFIAHLQRDADALRDFFGIDNVVDFPVVFLSRDEVAHYKGMDKRAWKARHNFSPDDIIILRAGYLAEHKDSLVSLKLMQILPGNYKLAFVGGQHPQTIQPYTVSPLVRQVTDFIDQFDFPAIQRRNHDPQANVTTLGDRVQFFGRLSDGELYEAIACADYVTVTHLDTSQGASGIGSIALQLERPCILTFNSFFLEYDKYWKDGFSMFSMGHHYELRDRILAFNANKLEKLERYGLIYCVDGLARLYQRLYQDMLSGIGNNAGRTLSQSIEDKKGHINSSVNERRSLARKALGVIRRGLKSLIQRILA